MCMVFSCSLPRRNPEKAGSNHHAPLPTSSMDSPPFLPIWKERWARLYPRPVAGFTPWNVSHFCLQEDEPGYRNAESAHVFGLARRSIERQLLTDQFTPQLIGKSRWEGGEWGKGGFGIRCTMCNLPTFHFLLLPVGVCLLSHSVWSDSETPLTVACQAPRSGFCLLMENDQWFKSSNLTVSVVLWKQNVML